MQLPDRQFRICSPQQARIGASAAVALAQTVLTGVAGEQARTNQKSRQAPVVQSDKVTQIICHGPVAADAHLPNSGAGIAELAGVRRSDNSSVVFQSIEHAALQRQPKFSPGRGNNARLNFVALHAVEDRRLVVLVQHARRNQHQSGAQIGGFTEGVLHEGLFHGNFAAGSISARDERMLHFKLGVEPHAVAEFVSEEKHKALQVRDIRTRAIVIIVVVDLAVTANGGLAVRGLPIHAVRRSGRFHASLRLLRHLRLERFQLSLQIVDFLFDRLLRMCSRSEHHQIKCECNDEGLQFAPLY